jgi:hypothetical protein
MSSEPTHRTRRIALRALAAILGTWHGLIGLIGLVLYRTGPEPTSMLVMSLTLVSTPGALVLGLWGGHRLAAGWLACAAMVWAVAGNREYGGWWYALLFYGPQLVAAYLFWRRNDGGASSLVSTLCATLAARRNPRSAGRWLIAAACLGAFAVGRALHLSPSSLAVNILMWWLPQVALGLLFMRTRRIEAEHGMHQPPPPIARTAAH